MSESVEHGIGLGRLPPGYDGLATDALRECNALGAQRMAEYQEAIARRNGGDMRVPDGAAVAAEPEPTGTPTERLATAKAAHAEAVARVAKVKDALGRAQDRAAADEHALASFSGIDDRLTRLMAARAYDADAETDLPIAEQVALTARARGVERHELSQRALRYVEGELRTAERDAQEADRRVRAAASAELMKQAQWLAEELVGVDAHAAELRARLKAYADCNLPGMGGAVALPPAAVLALNAPREELGRDLQLEAKLREQHTRLMLADSDGDA